MLELKNNNNKYDKVCISLKSQNPFSFVAVGWNKKYVVRYLINKKANDRQKIYLN